MAFATIYASTLLTGTISTPANALGAPDGVFTTDTAGDAWVGNWAFADPGVALTGTQTITVRARRSQAGGSNPNYSISLYESGALVAVLASGIAATQPFTDTVVTFDASQVANPANVEIHLEDPGTGGKPADRRTTQIDSIEWEYQFAEAQALTADNVDAQAPTLGAPGITESNVLAGDNVDAQAPTVGAPAITQAQVLAANGVEAQAPTVGAPAITQTQVLAANGVEAQAPTLGSPESGISSTFGSDSLSSQPPTLGTPAITQAQILAADTTEAQPPTVGAPAITQAQVLAADGIAAQAPTLGTPTGGQAHVLAADGVEAQAPTLGTPAATEEFVSVQPVDLTAGVPELGSPLATGGLEADPLTTGAPTLGTPGVVESIVNLAAVGITTGAVDIPVVNTAGVQELAADGVEAQAPTLGTPAATQSVFALGATPVEAQAPTLDAPAITQVSVLLADGLTAGAPQLGSALVALITPVATAGITTRAVTFGVPDARMYLHSAPGNFTYTAAIAALRKVDTPIVGGYTITARVTDSN